MHHTSVSALLMETVCRECCAVSMMQLSGIEDTEQEDIIDFIIYQLVWGQ